MVLQRWLFRVPSAPPLFSSCQKATKPLNLGVAAKSIESNPVIWTVFFAISFAIQWQKSAAATV